MNALDFDFDVLVPDGDGDIVRLSSSNVYRTVKTAQSVKDPLQDA